MALKTKKQSLADKINSLITAEPTNFCSDDEAEETRAKVVEQFEESDSDDSGLKSSSIRKQNVNLLDEIDDRYKGKKVSRKDVYENGSSDDDDDDELEQLDNENEDEMDDEESDSEGPDSDDNEVDDDNPLYRNRNDDVNFKNILSNDSRKEREKGNCVREQLKIWENLLEVRIQLQKCLAVSNKLPQFDVQKEYSTDKQFTKSKTEVTTKLVDLLENMLQVQNKLLKNYPETKNLLSTVKRTNDEEEEEDPMNEEICSDTEDEMDKNEEIANDSDDNESKEPSRKRRKTLTEYEKILSENHKKYIPYRNSIIQTWNDKTRVAYGKINKSASQPILKQIEFILNDKSKIIRRTQLKRSEYKIIGKVFKDEIDDDGRRVQEYDPEIYDDDDFYHQLLRELIERKSADITDPIQLSKQWIQLQNMRNKMKKKIDTRATKGRRIRYNVHNKLVNFMAPITINDTWSDLAKTELYNSLFGKVKLVENNTSNNVVNDNK